MMRKKQIENIVEPLGCTLLGIETGGKHAKVHLEYNGHMFMTTFPWTPSDRRFENNKRQDIKRHLKERGLWRGE